MNRITKDQAREIAADVFGRYPRANHVAVTCDGQAFITDDGDAAVRNHARANRYKEQLEIIPFNRQEFPEKSDEKAKNDSPKVVKPAAKKPATKKTVSAKKEAKAENRAEQNESEQSKKEE